MESPLPDQAAARDAQGWLHTTRFLTTAPELEHLPESRVAEVAFVGRSNVGKSTAINALTQQTQLAFASKRPGRTRDINLFAVGRQSRTDLLLADLPGYGYAAVAQADKARWQRVLTTYLMKRDKLSGVVLLCDARHGLRPLDFGLIRVIATRAQAGLALLLLLTKSDKLTRAEQSRALNATHEQCPDATVLLFSAPKRIGLDAACLWLQQRRENATAFSGNLPADLDAVKP